MLAARSNSRQVPKFQHHGFGVAVVHVLHAQQPAGGVDPRIHGLLQVLAVGGGVVDLERVAVDVALVRAEEVALHVRELLPLVRQRSISPALRVEWIDLSAVRVRGGSVDNQQGGAERGGEILSGRHGETTFLRDD
ncbi:hypothetical protein CKJ85_08435 [Corynebacterium sp. NML 150383]|nr:hypothetical protein CKJ85_08435 [Corynebacterium sp. NML 150383]